MNTQYITAPPDVPDFFYGSYKSSWDELIMWAKKENISRLRWLSRNGYFKEYRRHERDSSPVMLLAMHPNFRKFCAKMTETVWKSLSRKDKDMIILALDVRQKLTSTVRTQ